MGTQGLGGAAAVGEWATPAEAPGGARPPWAALSCAALWVSLVGTLGETPLVLLDGKPGGSRKAERISNRVDTGVAWAVSTGQVVDSIASLSRKLGFRLFSSLPRGDLTKWRAELGREPRFAP